MSTTLFEAREPTAGSPRTGPHGPAAPSRQRLSFPSVTASVGQARRFVADLLPDGGGEDNDAVVLMVSELATNAIEHAQSEFEVDVAFDPDGTAVRVGVRDASDTFPAPRQSFVDAPRGRGLQLVQTLSQAWGIEAAQGRPGKTVWFRAPVSWTGCPDGGPRGDLAAAAASTAAAASMLAPSGQNRHGAAVLPPWAARGVRSVLDSLHVGVVATDMQGIVRYVNAAAEELMGWPHGSLVGRSALDLVPESMHETFRDGFDAFFAAHAEDIAGQRMAAPIKRADGSEVDTEAVLSLVDDPAAGRIVVGLFRARDDQRLHRWSELTSELLEILADTTGDESPAERLLSTLGRRLDWDVTTLWAIGGGGRLLCRHVWTRSPDVAPDFAREKALDPTSGSEGLPRWVIANGEPLWVPDLAADPRFVTDAMAADGLKSAYAFPIRYRGTCVGIVKMLSRHHRERDASIVELMDAVGDHLGEWLHASALAAEREQLVEELLETRRGNEFLLLATQVLSEVVGYREMVQRLAQVAVPVMADLCLIDIVDENGQLRRMAAWHSDPTKRAMTDELRRNYGPDPAGPHPIVRVMDSGESTWSADMDDEFLRLTSRDERHFSILKSLGFTSYMTVPLRVRGEALGTVTLVSAGSGRRFGQKDLVLAEQLAQQVSAVVFRARAFDRERRISHELQRNLLPDAIPDIDGWDVAARYLPAAYGVEVGGDWYDVLALGDGLVALVVGDVEGHDLGAAKHMSRLRHTLGLLVLEERAPGKALERLNRVSLAGFGSRLATALVGVLDTRSGSATFSSAGHFSPVLVEPDRALELPVPPGPPLGVQACHYKDTEFRVGDGCLVMFTDGLVERRDVHIDARLELLEHTLCGSPGGHPELVADRAIAAMTGDAHSLDDIVVLAARRRVAPA